MMPPLLTPAQFAAGTGGKVSAEDPRVQTLLDGATAAIRNYCGWHITPVVPQTLVLDAEGGPLLALPTGRLVNVTNLTIKGQQPSDVADLEWSENGEVIAPTRRGWPNRFRSVMITIEHGYPSAADVVSIVQQVVANALSSPLGATSESAGSLSVSWATTAPGVSGGISLLQRDLDVLNFYRIGKRV